MFIVPFLLGLRAPDGELINRGDPSSKLLIHLGPPLVRETDNITIVNGQAERTETWTYRIKRITYYFTIQGGEVVKEEWTR
jgi:hypothetical protein